MKQTKKLLRRHWEFLKKNGVSQEVIDSLRFCEENQKVGYIFSLNGRRVVLQNGELVEYGV